MNWISEIIFGIAFLFLVEGALMALYPNLPRTIISMMAQIPASYMRRAGLIACILSLFVIWIIKG